MVGPMETGWAPSPCLLAPVLVGATLAPLTLHRANMLKLMKIGKNFIKIS